MPEDLYGVPHLIVPSRTQDKYYYYAWFTDEKAEAQRNLMYLWGYIDSKW